MWGTNLNLRGLLEGGNQTVDWSRFGLDPMATEDKDIPHIDCFYGHPVMVHSKVRRTPYIQCQNSKKKGMVSCPNENKEGGWRRAQYILLQLR